MSNRKVKMNLEVSVAIIRVLTKQAQTGEIVEFDFGMSGVHQWLKSTDKQLDKQALAEIFGD